MGHGTVIMDVLTTSQCHSVDDFKNLFASATDPPMFIFLFLIGSSECTAEDSLLQFDRYRASRLMMSKVPLAEG